MESLTSLSIRASSYGQAIIPSLLSGATGQASSRIAAVALLHEPPSCWLGRCGRGSACRCCTLRGRCSDPGSAPRRGSSRRFHRRSAEESGDWSPAPGDGRCCRALAANSKFEATLATFPTAPPFSSCFEPELPKTEGMTTHKSL